MKRSLVFCSCLLLGGATAAELPDLNTVTPDLTVPPLTSGAPAPGRRVQHFLPAFQGTPIHHVLYLPTDWQPGARYPVLVEYAGNGGYSNKFGDVSTGLPEGSKLGYGISGGTHFIWLCLPYVDAREQKIATQWWGDVDATLAYCRQAVRMVCDQFGGDPSAVILCGFSRGAIACGYLGLHDDDVAKLWRAFIPYSHYDGVHTWNYPASDAASAIARMQRLHGRPTFVCQEGSVEATKTFIAASGVQAPFTFQAVPFRNHNDAWTLRDSPARQALRAWLQDALRTPPAAGAVSKKTVVCFGDSITHLGYPQLIAEQLGVTVINAGVGGNTTRAGLARMAQDVLALHPDAVTILFGTNDSVLDRPRTYKVPPQQYEANLTEMVTRCRQAGAQVVLATLPPIVPEPYFHRHPQANYDAEGGLDKVLANYQAIAQRVGKAQGVPVVDLHSTLAKDWPQHTRDGVHPDAEMSRQIAAQFAASLAQALALPPPNR
jgi:lysophospholipase L1-like esterase